MLRVVLISIVLLLIGCSYEDVAHRSAEHHHFTMGKAVLHTQRSLLEVTPCCQYFFDTEFTLGSLELLGRGIMQFGRADYHSVNEHLHTLRLGEFHNLTFPFYIEIQHSPDDSLTLLIKYSYSCESDTLFEVVEGTLYIPLQRDSDALYHKLQLDGLPLQEIDKGKGASESLMLDIECLLM